MAKNEFQIQQTIRNSCNELNENLKDLQNWEKTIKEKEKEKKQCQNEEVRFFFCFYFNDFFTEKFLIFLVISPSQKRIKSKFRRIKN